MTAPSGFSIPLRFALPPRAKEVVPILESPGLAAACFGFQLQPPTECIILAVKATFALVPGGVATWCEEAEPLSGDEPLSDDVVNPPGEAHEGGSLARATDFAPWKPRADVTLTGHAYPSHTAHAAHTAQVSHVALTFGALHQRAAVLGDREWHGEVPTAPATFDRMPLVWERAFGGKGFPKNPCGRGFHGAMLPNLEQATGLIRSPKDAPEPVCFAPVPREWQLRAHKLGTYDAAWRAQRWPYFPRDFDWSYMNAAPVPLQIDYPTGAEHFELAGVHPTLPSIVGTLPGLRARAFALGTDEAGSTFRELPLKLDTVSFDADALRVSLVWRGHLEASHACAPEVSRFYVILEPTAEPTPISGVFARMTEELVARYGPGVILPSNDPPVVPAAPPPQPKAPTPRVDRAQALEFIASRESLAGADLAGYDLSAVELSHRDLAGANLVGALLEGANLSGANLSGARLTRAYAPSVNLRGANLAGANLAEAVLTASDLSSAVLDYATLAEAHAVGARFEGAALAHANLTDAVFDDAVFDRAVASGAAFSGAWLRRASFVEATLEDAQAYEIEAEGASFDRARMARLRGDGAKLSRASFVGADASDASFDSAVLAAARLDGVTLSDAVLAHADFTGAVLDRATLKGARLRYANLERAACRKANLMEASLEGANLHQADLRGANLYGCNLNGASLDGTQLELAILANTLLAPH